MKKLYIFLLIFAISPSYGLAFKMSQEKEIEEMLDYYQSLNLENKIDFLKYLVGDKKSEGEKFKDKNSLEEFY